MEGDSSDSSEYAPEQQYQVRTDSDIQTLLPKETVNQNATKCALLADETATTSGEEHVASPPKSQTGSILNFLWSVNLALATFVALKFIQEMHLASHRVMHRNYRMHQKLLALS